MLLRVLLFFLVTVVSAIPVDNVIIDDTPTEEDGAAVARTLVNRESLANVNTIKLIKQSDGTTLHLPVSAVEYYADCDNDGDPYWLVIDIGGPNQNIIKGSPFSFTIRVGDHPKYDKDVSDEYPGSIDGSVAGSPRVQLTGSLRSIYFDNPFDPKKLALEKCFLQRHPDASAWLPSNYLSPHKSHWAKLKVDGAYLIGGFGGRGYIGEIDSELYHSADIIE